MSWNKEQGESNELNDCDKSMESSQFNVENSNQKSTITSSQFQSLDFVELDWNNFQFEANYGPTSTQKGEWNLMFSNY